MADFSYAAGEARLAAAEVALTHLALKGERDELAERLRDEEEKSREAEEQAVALSQELALLSSRLTALEDGDVLHQESWMGDAQPDGLQERVEALWQDCCQARESVSLERSRRLAEAAEVSALRQKLAKFEIDADHTSWLRRQSTIQDCDQLRDRLSFEESRLLSETEEVSALRHELEWARRLASCQPEFEVVRIACTELRGRLSAQEAREAAAMEAARHAVNQEGIAIERRLTPIVEAAQQRVEDSRAECGALQQDNLHLQMELRRVRKQQALAAETSNSRAAACLALQEQAVSDRRYLGELEAECLSADRMLEQEANEEVAALRCDLAMAVAGFRREHALAQAFEHSAEANAHGFTAQRAEIAARLTSEELRSECLEALVRDLKLQIASTGSAQVH
ncbi:unnamed protein product [Polarella glacialis]|uniref:Uncharacterized protein n=1 Tax=Polarella glacialis TaxID=89957 RepID=A0A813FPZ2_POLGL|nr:unnamed protein product [Polarella glacialis]